jgi:LPPG:FO 2-phospho-L-lactate transferase
MGTLRSLGGEDWFLLGDGDLALHVLRTAWRARMLIDERDASDLAIPTASANTLMMTQDDRVRVVRAALELAQRLAA